MDPVFSWIEQSMLSVWLRESPSLFAFPTVLILHTVGMGFLIGANAAIDLRILGFAAGVPLFSMQKFIPVLWFGFWVNAFSGLLLLAAYPTKALTNPIFYIKLVMIALALLAYHFLRDRVLNNPVLIKGTIPGKYKALACASLFCWIAATASGRFLAYTYRWMLVGERGVF